MKTLSLLVVVIVVLGAQACTNFLVTPGASVDGSSMVSYNADSHTLYGSLARYPAADHPPGSTVKIYDWETNEYRGEIPQVPHTYSVVGNMNEFQVTIGETTFGGLPELASQPGAIIDYGSLIYLALQRSRTAREAIKVMTDLVAQYGYASDGESFSIADPKEVWLMELIDNQYRFGGAVPLMLSIGKGPYEKGAVWVATRIPDGMVCAHANQARTRTFPRDDPENVLYAPDVVSFAVAHGFYPATADPLAFSFSDVYNPLTFEGARACEARVWSFFSKINSDMNQYLDYAQGYNLTNRMPLYIKPNRSLSVADVKKYMRDHYEGTWFDFSSRDVGATAWQMPYRWRPLDWKQTGWTFVAQMRSFLPNAIGGVFWFGVDDSAFAVHVPIFAGVTDIPKSVKTPTDVPGIMTFSFDSAFWVFNLRANWVYTRDNLMYTVVIAKIEETEANFRKQATLVEKAYLQLYTKDAKKATSMITNFSVTTFDTLTKDWLNYFTYLFVKYMDGNVKTPNPKNPWMPNVAFPGMGPVYQQLIVEQTGDHYLETSSEQPKLTKTTQFSGMRGLNAAPSKSRARKL